MDQIDSPTDGNSPEEEARLTEESVNRHATGPTEGDEMEVLQELYGDPDADGVFAPGFEDVEEGEDGNA